MKRGPALVTGCSSGFGLRIALMLARRGFQVFATMRDLDRGDALREALGQSGLQATLLRLDVTEPRSVERAVGQVLEAHGAIDVLVNNAGAMLTGFVEELSDDELLAQLDVNLLGPLRLIRACLPSMRERRHVLSARQHLLPQGVDPTGAIRAAAMLLEHLGQHERAAALERQAREAGPG